MNGEASSMINGPLLEIRSLNVSYGKGRALKDVSLSVMPRTVTALMGPSGCGKSTFLRALNRMHELYGNVKVRGEVYLHSHQINLLSKKIPVEWVRSHMGMVFQKPNPFPKSIFENVAYGLRVVGGFSKSQIAERVEEVLISCGLWAEVKDRLTTNALSLSGGQQQRLCVARALAPKPEILLMDEPTSALDPISTQVIEQLITDLAKQTTIMLVTHNMNQARRVSHQTAFFYLGELVEVGATQQIFTQPQKELTRNYLKGVIG